MQHQDKKKPTKALKRVKALLAFHVTNQQNQAIKQTNIKTMRNSSHKKVYIFCFQLRLVKQILWLTGCSCQRDQNKVFQWFSHHLLWRSNKKPSSITFLIDISPKTCKCYSWLSWSLKQYASSSLCFLCSLQNLKN